MNSYVILYSRKFTCGSNFCYIHENKYSTNLTVSEWFLQSFKCFFISANSKENDLLQTELIAIFSDHDLYLLYFIWFDFYLQCNHWKKYVIIQSPFIQVHLCYARSKYK